jgi:hypothetical protein
VKQPKHPRSFNPILFVTVHLSIHSATTLADTSLHYCLLSRTVCIMTHASNDLSRLRNVMTCSDWVYGNPPPMYSLSICHLASFISASIPFHSRTSAVRAGRESDQPSKFCKGSRLISWPQVTFALAIILNNDNAIQQKLRLSLKQPLDHGPAVSRNVHSSHHNLAAILGETRRHDPLIDDFGDVPLVLVLHDICLSFAMILSSNKSTRALVQNGPKHSRHIEVNFNLVNTTITKHSMAKST